MATLIKHRNQFLSKIQKWNGVRQIATHIPLRTNKKSDAIARHLIVEKSEQHIKEGIIVKHQFKDYFGWLNQKGTSTLVHLTLEEAVKRFIKAHSVNVAQSSMERIVVSLNCMLPLWKENTPIKNITNKHIEEFKEEYKEKHSVSGINLNLRNIKTFLRWCVDEKLLKNMPKIKMLKEPRRLPKYIKEIRLGKIINAVINPFMQRAFSLLVTTGCRRSEVIEGVLEGKFLIVPATISKSRIEREIPLNTQQLEIVKEIHKNRDTYLLKGHKLRDFKNKFTKDFKKACVSLGYDYTLHCLRHTFAVVQWIISNDIYEVKNLLGHTSVKTTEKYASFRLDKLEQDFPSAYKVRLEVEKVRKNSINTPLINTPLKEIEESSSSDSAIA